MINWVFTKERSMKDIKLNPLSYSFCLGAMIFCSLPSIATAADVQIYGRADAGLVYTHIKGGEDTLQMKNGRSTPRFGLNIRENLTNGWKIKGYLENGFQLDTGNFGTTGKIFDRRSILAVSSPYGELGAGRAGTVQSSMAPYSMGLLRWDPFGTSYGNASIASTFANSGRLSNGLHYISPEFNGFKFGASYTLGDEDIDTVKWSDKSHTLALAGNYKNEDVFLGLTFANITSKHEGVYTKPDARLYQIGGWWTASPGLKVFAAAGYQTHFSTAAKLASSKLLKGGVTKEQSLGGFNGESFLIGTTYTIGKNKFIADAQFFTGKLSRNHDVNFKRAVFAAAWEYWFSKRVIGYLATTYSMTSGSAESAAKQAGGYSLEATQVYCGLDYHF